MLVVDTNIIAYFFAGLPAAGQVIQLNEIAISSITYTEVLCNKLLTNKQRILVTDFLDTLFVCHTNQQIVELAVFFSGKYNLKPMDALIVATAKFLRANLVTADKQLFKISEVKVVQIKNE